MKSALIDASSAILLHKAKLFHEMAVSYRLLMVPTVFREVTVRDHIGVDVFHRAERSGGIQILQPDPSDTTDMRRASLDAGEAETIWAYDHQDVDFIIIDDGKGARACRSEGIPYINALLCPNLLYWSRKIDAVTRREAFLHLQYIGRYAPDVIDFAQNSTAPAMRRFLP